MVSLFSSSTEASKSGLLGWCPWYAQFGSAVLALGLLLGLQVDAELVPTAETATVSDMSAAPVVLPDDGEQIYNTRCMSCHQMGGRGVPGTFPPLRDTDWVNGDKGRLIRLLLHGVSGSMEVKGQTYSGSMPPWKGALGADGIAAVATYIRSNFGNDSSPVTTEEVEKVDAATKGRKKPWSAKELMKAENRGVPGDSSDTGDEKTGR